MENMVNNLTTRLITDIENQLDDYIWDQIKKIIKATGKFDRNDWIIEERPDQILSDNDSETYTYTRYVRLRPQTQIEHIFFFK